MIEIISSEGELKPITLKDPGLRHLALAVSDFDAVYGQLKARNVNFLVEAADNKGVKTAFFTDPEGNILHIIQRETPLP
jgi:glyoxylase I family protein